MLTASLAMVNIRPISMDSNRLTISTKLDRHLLGHSNDHTTTGKRIISPVSSVFVSNMLYCVCQWQMLMGC